MASTQPVPGSCSHVQAEVFLGQQGVWVSSALQAPGHQWASLLFSKAQCLAEGQRCSPAKGRWD